MVVHGRLQLLPRSTRIESAVVRLGGEKMLRAAYPRDGREPNRLHLDGSRCASHSRLSSGRCEMITRYYPIIRLRKKWKCVDPGFVKPFKYAEFIPQEEKRDQGYGPEEQFFRRPTRSGISGGI